MTMEMAVVIAQLLMRYGPETARGVVTLFSKPNPTLEDWNAIFDSVKTYDEMDAASKARVGSTTTTVTV